MTISGSNVLLAGLLLQLHLTHAQYSEASEENTTCGHGALSWRIVASKTRSNYWDVVYLSFVTDKGIVKLNEDCNVIHSGSASDKEHGGYRGYKPENAFSDNHRIWGGRKRAGEFYLGINCTKPQVVRSVQILQRRNCKHSADVIQVQLSNQSKWTTVRATRLYEPGVRQTIEIGCAGKSNTENASTDLAVLSTTEHNHSDSESVSTTTMSYSPNTAEQSHSESEVHGVLALSILPGYDTNTKLELQMHSTFLSDTIAETYGLQSVSILSIGVARRLQAAEVTRFHAKFEGVGAITPNVPSTVLLNAIRPFFEARGLLIESAFVEFTEGTMPDGEIVQNASETSTTVQGPLILFATAGVFCTLLALTTFMMVWTRCKKTDVTQEVVVSNPVVSPQAWKVDKDDTKGNDELESKPGDNDTASESTRTPSTPSHDGVVVVVDLD